MKVAVIGTIDESHKEVSGQYDRTEIVKDGLVQRGYEVDFVNMMNWKRHPFKLLISIIRAYFHCDIFVFLASLNGTRLVLFTLYLLRFFKKRKAYQIAIGGMGNCIFIKEHPFYNKQIKKLDAVFVEIKSMIKAYADANINNTIYLPNCKHLRLNEVKQAPSFDKPYRFCTYSRVTPEKGIEEAINAVKTLNEEKGPGYCTLDIYGTFLEEDKEWFENLMKESPQYITYKARINREDSIKVLSQYDMMLFFTTHTGEGVPGGLIDSYEASLPIISYDTSFMKDIVKDNYTGFIVDTPSQEGIVKTILHYTEGMSIDEKVQIRKNCLAEAAQFDTESVLDTLCSTISK